MAETYITPADLPTFYDSRRVLQLASDDPNSPAQLADLSSTASAPYAIVNQCIQSAASDVDTHCQQGKRYTRATLELIVSEWLADVNDPAKKKRAAVLRQMVADLAYGYLIGRRGMSAKALNQLCPRYEEAQAALEKLALGIMVFDLDAAINAGVPQFTPMNLNGWNPSLNNGMFGIWPDRAYGGRSSNYYFGGW